jgi:hypothetical protein
MDLFSQFGDIARGFALNSVPGNGMGESSNAFLTPLPASHMHLSAVLIRENLAVIPGEWKSGSISKPTKASMNIALHD